jgi:hypothetical protein
LNISIAIPGQGNFRLKTGFALLAMSLKLFAAAPAYLAKIVSVEPFHEAYTAGPLLPDATVTLGG